MSDTNTPFPFDMLHRQSSPLNYADLAPRLHPTERSMIDEVYRAICMGDNLNIGGCSGTHYHFWITEAVDGWSAAVAKGLVL